MEFVNDIQLMSGLGLQNNSDTLSKDEVFYYYRGKSCRSEADAPILVLIHGYPQTNFMWRQMIPLLPDDIPLFVPDIPGYGRSRPLPGQNNKSSVGTSILGALRVHLTRSATYVENQPIILVGHDRGARICHRLAVDSSFHPDFTFRGTVLLDIVPTLVQWQSFTDLYAAVRSFHWPFLANVEFATSMIQQQGGEPWVAMCLRRWAGGHFDEIFPDDIVEVYSRFFRQEAVIRATCDDYRAGAQEDVLEQKLDKEKKRGLGIDVLVVYSENYLGSRYDMQEVWSQWMDGGHLRTQPISGNFGHFLAEEAPAETASHICDFYRNHRFTELEDRALDTA